MVGSIDPRREAHRRAHWRSNAAAVFGPRIADTILASGHVRPHPKGRTYDRKRSHPKIRTEDLAGGGRSLIAAPSSRVLFSTAPPGSWFSPRSV
jgi:hypothetical protein